MAAITARNSFGWEAAPAFLLTPLGWVINRLGNAIETEPALLEPLLELDQARMHLIALALAHLSSEVCPDLALVLLRGPYREILDLSLGHRSPGLARALACLPPKVLTAESYRKLTALLTDRTTARFLHHCHSIDEAMIAGLDRLPADLRRPAILAMFGRVEGMDQFVDGLRCLAARAGLPFEVLASQIGSLDQTVQVVAKIKRLTESLPLLDTLPPARVGPYRRLDQIAEIVDVFTRRLEVPRYARVVSFEEIEKNEFNLNLPRYIDSQSPRRTPLIVQRWFDAASAEPLVIRCEVGTPIGASIY